MTRAHRQRHLLIWLILTPVIAIILWQSLLHRPEAPVNDSLPPLLTEDAG